MLKRLALVLTLGVSLTSEAGACHRFSVWKYPWPQRCSVRVAQVDTLPPVAVPTPPVKPPEPDVEIPLPTLEGMEFPPDCVVDWCQRLKGIGMLREKLGTN